MKIHNMQEKRLLKAILVMSIIAGAAQATTYEYAAPLTSPPGMYFGTGNQNVDMAIADTGVVELGLSAIIRFQGPVDPGAGSSTYIVPTGILSGGLPRWGFIFSVNTQYNGGTAVLGDFAELSVAPEAAGSSAVRSAAFRVGTRSARKSPIRVRSSVLSCISRRRECTSASHISSGGRLARASRSVFRPLITGTTRVPDVWAARISVRTQSASSRNWGAASQSGPMTASSTLLFWAA